jgi:hypothetical protein
VWLFLAVEICDNERQFDKNVSPRRSASWGISGSHASESRPCEIVVTLKILQFLKFQGGEQPTVKCSLSTVNGLIL